MGTNETLYKARHRTIPIGLVMSCHAMPSQCHILYIYLSPPPPPVRPTTLPLYKDLYGILSIINHITSNITEPKNIPYGYCKTISRHWPSTQIIIKYFIMIHIRNGLDVHTRRTVLALALHSPRIIFVCIDIGFNRHLTRNVFIIAFMFVHITSNRLMQNHIRNITVSISAISSMSNLL